MTTYWTVSAGADDPHAMCYDGIAAADLAAAERSLHTYHHTAYVARCGGQRIRTYRDGVCVGWLDGNTQTWKGER